MRLRLFAACFLLSCVTQVSSASPQSCKSEVEGLEALAASAEGKTVIIGEPHGTVEIPAVVSSLVCLMAMKKAPILVGLEWQVPRSAVYQYLSSDGGAEALAALLTSPSWQAERQDGRYSAAMLALLEDIRRLRQAGLIIDVEPFVPIAIETAQGMPSDNEMARTRAEKIMVRQIFGDDDSLRVTAYVSTVILTGWGHAPKIPLGVGAMQRIPMAAHFNAKHTIFLEIGSNGGVHWQCMDEGSCGVLKLPAKFPQSGNAKIMLRESPSFDGYIFLPSLTASPPAREATTAPRVP